MPETPAAHVVPAALGWKLALYALLTVLGILSQRAAIAVLAIAWLIAALTWPALGARGRGVVIAVAALAVVATALAPRLGNAALDALPILVNAALAWLFARSLRRGRQPLIARVIATVEDPTRLADTRVARYARRLTAAWAAWLALLAALLAAAWLLLHMSALGHATGLAAGPAAWLQTWTRLGCYLALAVFFGAEYLWRRHALPHVPQLGLATFVTRMIQRWPAIVHDAVH